VDSDGGKDLDISDSEDEGDKKKSKAKAKQAGRSLEEDTTMEDETPAPTAAERISTLAQTKVCFLMCSYEHALTVS
jgi:protein SDA1